jgi:tetratricopeptide (TPR) repeat protein
METMRVCKPLLGSLLRLACGFSMVFLLLLPASAQLSPEAQKLYDQGMAAWKQQLWDQAIAGFAAAQKLAPKEPSVLYSLAMAHDKAGNSLDAAAWFRAHLAAAPNAPVAAEVRSEIARLDESNIQTMRKIFANALTAARQIPLNSDRWWGLFDIAQNQAQVGLIDDALVTVQEADTLARTIPAESSNAPGKPSSRIEYPPVSQSTVWREYVGYLVDMHSLPKAQESLNHIADPAQVISAKLEIASGMAWKAQYDEVQNLLAVLQPAIRALPDPEDQANCLIDLADLYTSIHKPEIASGVLSYAEALARKNKVHITNLDFTFSQSHERITEAESGNYASFEAESDRTDEVDDRLIVADTISASDVDSSVAEGLKQVNQGNPGAGSEKPPDVVADHLSQVAFFLGHFLMNMESIDAIEYQSAPQ